MEKIYIPAIIYHQVLSEGMRMLERKPGEGVYSGQIYRKDFLRQMDHLADQGYTTIRHDQMYAWLAGTGELPPKPIVIDFDDHSMISYKNALPVMRERGQVATMFVVSGLAAGDPTLQGEWWSVARMRWRELEKLVEAGWEIGAHTRTHLFFTGVPEGAEGDKRIMDELVRGKEDIRANLGVTPHHFAYPGGVREKRVETMVKKVYQTARLGHYVGKAEYITGSTDPYRLPGMNTNYLLPFEDFERLVSRSHPDYEYYPESCRIGEARPPERQWGLDD